MSRGEAIKRPLITSSDLPHHLYRKEPRGEAETRSLITPLQPSFPITYTEDGLVGKFFPDSPTTYGEEQLVGKLASVRLFAGKRVRCLPPPARLSVCHAFSSVAVAVFAFAQVRARPSGAPVCLPPPPPSCARVIGACVVPALAETGALLVRRCQLICAAGQDKPPSSAAPPCNAGERPNEAGVRAFEFEPLCSDSARSSVPPGTACGLLTTCCTAGPNA